MNTDLLQDFSASEILKKQLRKNLQWQMVLFCFSFIFLISQARYWFNMVSREGHFDTGRYTFYYKLIATAGFIHVIATTYGLFLTYQGYKIITYALEQGNSDMFLKVLKYLISPRSLDFHSASLASFKCFLYR